MSDYQSELDNLKKEKKRFKIKKMAIPVFLILVVIGLVCVLYYRYSNNPNILYNDINISKKPEVKLVENTKVKDNTNKSSVYKNINFILNDVNKALENNDFTQAKILLRQTEDLADNPKAQELAKEWVKFGDSALAALTKTGDKDMLDIPKHWYELAQIINNTPKIQAKINACK